MGSVPRTDTGVGSAANGTFLQVGGALGIAVVGSLLSTRYQNRMTEALQPFHVPPRLTAIIDGSLGGALQAANRLGGTLGGLLGHTARTAFLSGMDVGLRTGAAVALTGAVIAIIGVPGRHSGEST